MITVVTANNIGYHLSDIAEMHRLRYRVFYERLGWDVEVSGGMEIDIYDAQMPAYLLHHGEAGQVDGCVRMLPTKGPYMLRDTFPVLAGSAPIPRHPLIWEASRFSVATEDGGSRNRSGLTNVTGELFAGLVEHGLALGLTSIVAVVDLRMERILRRAGWPLERMAPPQQVGITKAVAGHLKVSWPALTAIYEAGGIQGPVIEPIPQAQAA